MAVDVKYHPQAGYYINNFVNVPAASSAALGRFEHYKPLLDSILTAHGVPTELGIMVLGNSLADCAYYDSEGNSGPWAMPYNVARMFDLKVNTYVDERRDLKKSTEAAARYLKELKTIYRDWHLAMAAFASTTTSINKTIRLGGNVFDYWTIYDSLPEEAKPVVPRYIAAVYLFVYHKAHNITPKTYTAIPYDTLSVKKWMSFEVMAPALHASVQDIYELNPEFRRGIVPMSPVPYVVKLPLKSRQWYSSVDSLEYKPYNTNPYIEVPELENKDLPKRKIDGDSAVADTAATAKEAVSDTIIHIVKRGEGLGIIARKYGVTVDQLRKWNHIKGYTIHAGKRLIILRKEE